MWLCLLSNAFTNPWVQEVEGNKNKIGALYYLKAEGASHLRSGAHSPTGVHTSYHMAVHKEREELALGISTDTEEWISRIVLVYGYRCLFYLYYIRL